MEALSRGVKHLSALSSKPLIRMILSVVFTTG